MRARIYADGGELLGEVELRDRARRRPLAIAEKITVVIDEPTRRDRDLRPLFLSGKLEPLL